jgi:hypothetical protein
MATDPQMFIRIAANLDDLKTAMAQAREAVLAQTAATQEATAASTTWGTALDDLGPKFFTAVVSGQLLVDALIAIAAGVKDAAEAFPELALRGAVVNDIEQAFEHLTAGAGLLSDALMTTLRAATHGTVDDFALMQRVNKDLAAGLQLSQAQFGMLGQAAFALSKSLGIDEVEALDQVSNALVTGRAKGVAMLTGKIDLKAAEEAYAVSLGGTGKQLDAAQKLYADQQAILAAVQAGLGRVGDQQDSLKDKVTQGEVAWANFTDALGKSIANSPVIAAGFDGVRAALTAAFGGDQQAQVAAITGKVNSAAIVVMDFGLGAVETARVFNVGWSAIETVVLSVEAGLMTVVAAYDSVTAKVDAAKAALPFASQGMKDIAAASQVAADDAWVLAKGLDAEAQEAAKGVVGHSALDATLDRLGGSLLTTRDGMIAASLATTKATDAAVQFVGPLQAVNTQLKDLPGAADKYAKAWDAAQQHVADLWTKEMAAELTQAAASDALHLTQLDKRAADDAKALAAGVAAGQISEQTAATYTMANLAQLTQRKEQLYQDEAALKEQVVGNSLAKEIGLENTRLSEGKEDYAQYQEALTALTQTAAVTRQGIEDQYRAAKLQRFQDELAEQARLQQAQDDKDAAAQAKKLVDQANALTAGYQALASMALSFSTPAGQAQTDATFDQYLQTYSQWWSGSAADLNKFIVAQMKITSDARAAGLAAMHLAGVPGYATGTGGFVDFGAGTMAMLHGVEAVVPESAVSPGSSGAGLGPTVNVYITQPLGTPQQIAAVVGPAIMSVLNTRVQLRSA